MREKIEPLLSKEVIEKKICELAEQLNKRYDGKELTLVCILKGGAYFATDLSRKLTVPTTIGFMNVSSYGDSTESGGNIKIEMDLDESIKDKHVLIVEDIIDSGRTLSRLKELLLSRGPASLEIITLLNKPDRRVAQIEADYAGFTIPDAFVVGFGLDYAQRYRNLDYIGVISFEED